MTSLKQAYNRWYWRSPRGKETQRRYHASEKCRATRAKYYKTVLKPRREGAMS
jgi:hypothetical protein